MAAYTIPRRDYFSLTLRPCTIINKPRPLHARPPPCFLTLVSLSARRLFPSPHSSMLKMISKCRGLRRSGRRSWSSWPWALSAPSPRFPSRSSLSLTRYIYTHVFKMVELSVNRNSRSGLFVTVAEFLRWWMVDCRSAGLARIRFSFCSFPYEFYGISTQNDLWTEVAQDKPQGLQMLDRSTTQLAKMSIFPSSLQNPRILPFTNFQVVL